MFSALKKLTRNNDARCPVPMSSSLQKKFSRGVHYNMKILIKGDRNVGKSCLLQRLQGGTFIEEYVPTDQIQVAPIHWTYKNTDHIVKVEVWEVVDKGRTKKKSPIGLKLENQSASTQDDGYETPILDATFLDVYKNANGVILMLDITKPWTFDYVVKELSHVPADIPVVVLGNHCDMQHHRQVHSHHIDQALHQARITRTAPVRYAESSMRNGFGLRLLHKFLSVPFLRLQKTSLLEQLQRNQKDIEDIEKELDDFQSSEESQYNIFVDRLANRRRQDSTNPEPRPDRSPSIVLGAGKPIVPHNPLLSQSINPTTVPQTPTAKYTQEKQRHYVSPELTKPKHPVDADQTPAPTLQNSDDSEVTDTRVPSSGPLDDFYAGNLDSSFLEDLSPLSTHQEYMYESESDDGNPTNPNVIVDEDDLDIDYNPTSETIQTMIQSVTNTNNLAHRLSKVSVVEEDIARPVQGVERPHHIELSLDNDYPIWVRDASVRRSPEGGEDPDVAPIESEEKVDKKHKKKKSKDKDKQTSDYGDKSERKHKKHKRNKSKDEKSAPHPQMELLAPAAVEFNYEEYDCL